MGFSRASLSFDGNGGSGILVGERTSRKREKKMNQVSFSGRCRTFAGRLATANFGHLPTCCQAKNIKDVTAKYTAPDLIAQLATVSGDINLALHEKLSLYGAQMIPIDRRNFAFSDAYRHTVSEKVTQKQLRLGAENKLKTVEAEQKRKVALPSAIYAGAPIPFLIVGSGK
jgi:hypothetical protein